MRMPFCKYYDDVSINVGNLNAVQYSRVKKALIKNI